MGGKSKGYAFYGGINDVTGATKRIIDGKEKSCPIYCKWLQMFRRCYEDWYLDLHLLTRVVRYVLNGRRIVTLRIGRKLKSG